jgi:hypothetical protein
MRHRCAGAVFLLRPALAVYYVYSTAQNPSPPGLLRSTAPRRPAMQQTPFMESMHDADDVPDASGATRRPPDTTLPANVNDIAIKNHFPVARIKRIMQADDDVGKVAQVTPVVVCT